jgi:hypothetical protein
VQLVLEQGSATRTIYPQSPSTINIEEVSYLHAYGLPLGVGLTTVLLSASLVVLVVRSRRAKARQRPEVVKAFGGPGVALSRYQTITIGGEGCTIAVPGIKTRGALATAEWTGVRGELHITPAEGFRLKIGGMEMSGAAVYRMGQPLQFTDLSNNATYDVTLYGGTNKDINLNYAAHVGADSSEFGDTFPNFGDLTGRGPSGLNNTSAPHHNGNGAGNGHYI